MRGRKERVPGVYKMPRSLKQRMRFKEYRLLKKAWAVWRPPLAMSISEWSREFRRMPAGVTSEPGRYDPDRLPWCRFILDTIGARTYQDCVLVGAAQVMGKTEILNSVVGFFVHAEPSPILVKYPTKESAEAWSKSKLDPMIQATPALKELFGEVRARDSGNTMTEKRFPGGSITMIGANSPSGMRQRSKKIVIQDEIDADEHSAGVEGDPVSLADKRAESYGDRVLVKASTPTIAGVSRCWKLLENSTFHEWWVKCPHCGEYHVLSMANLKWPKTMTEDGKKVAEHHVADAYYECPHCAAKWDDLDRQRAIMAGQARARNPKSRRFGFHVGGFYKLIGGSQSHHSMLHEFAEAFLDQAAAGPEEKKVYRNTFEAMPWEDTFEKLDERAVLARAENYDPAAMLPAGVLRIAGAADVQHDRIEAELVGYGEGEETWGLGYAVFHGDTSKPGGPWDDLDKFRAKVFAHPSGKALGCAAFFVDSGNQQDRVIAYTAPRRSLGVYACKGKNVPGKQDPILPRKPSVNNKQKAHQWLVGVTAAKTVIYSRIMLPVPGPGSMHFPRGHGYDERYYRQLTSERRMTRYSHGRPYFIYESGERRNEPLDIRVYALAAHRLTPFDAVRLRAELGPILDVTASSSPDVPRGTISATAQVGPSAGGMQFERAPVEVTTVGAFAPLVSAAPAAARVASVKLPAYVPMHLRAKRA